MSVWDLDTGEKTMQFSRCHGDMELTAMIFDPSGRRLITGGRDGSLKIWNFNNGACLNVLENRFTLEVDSFCHSSILSFLHSAIPPFCHSPIHKVTSLCFLKQQIIVGGWNQLLSAYRCVHSPFPALVPIPSPHTVIHVIQTAPFPSTSVLENTARTFSASLARNPTFSPLPATTGTSSSGT